MTIVVTTPPATEPVTLAEVKAFVRIDSGDTSMDTELATYITSATLLAQHELNRYLVTQTLTKYLDRFPMSGVGISLPPLASVSSITYLDSNGDSQTLAGAQYVVDAKSKPSRIMEAYNVSWPSTYDQVNAVSIEFIAGYGAASAVPACIKTWIMLRVSDSLDNKSPVNPSRLSESPRPYVDGLLDPERIFKRVS